MTSDRLWFRLVDTQGNPCENVFDRIRVMADPSTPKEFPKTQIEENLRKGMIAFRQTLPYSEPEKYDAVQGHPKDKAFRLSVVLNCLLEKRSQINWDGNKQDMAPLEAEIKKQKGFVGCISLQEGLNSVVAAQLPEVSVPLAENFNSSLNESGQIWKDYWNKSGVKLGDQFLERM